MKNHLLQALTHVKILFDAETWVFADSDVLSVTEAQLVLLHKGEKNDAFHEDLDRFIYYADNVDLAAIHSVNDFLDHVISQIEASDNGEVLIKP